MISTGLTTCGESTRSIFLPLATCSRPLQPHRPAGADAAHTKVTSTVQVTTVITLPHVLFFYPPFHFGSTFLSDRQRELGCRHSPLSCEIIHGQCAVRNLVPCARKAVDLVAGVCVHVILKTKTKNSNFLLFETTPTTSLPHNEIVIVWHQWGICAPSPSNVDALRALKRPRRCPLSGFMNHFFHF